MEGGRKTDRHMERINYKKRWEWMQESECECTFSYFVFFLLWGGSTEGLNSLARKVLYHLSHSASIVLCWVFVR
jgi:hypothetical protein